MSDGWVVTGIVAVTVSVVRSTRATAWSQNKVTHRSVPLRTMSSGPLVVLLPSVMVEITWLAIGSIFEM